MEEGKGIFRNIQTGLTSPKKVCSAVLCLWPLAAGRQQLDPRFPTFPLLPATSRRRLMEGGSVRRGDADCLA